MSNYSPTEGQKAPVGTAEWERITGPYMQSCPFDNCRLEDGLGVTDFYLDRILRARNPMTAGAQRKDLLEAFSRYDLLQSVTVTTDTDGAQNLRFINFHFPLDEHVEERLALAANVVQQWREIHYYTWG